MAYSTADACTRIGERREVPMSTVLGFDVYGTLIDTIAVGAEIEGLLPGRGIAFAAAWRQKQLEYTFRRAAMETYRDFDVCTAAALEHTSAAFGAQLTDAQEDRLLDHY